MNTTFCQYTSFTKFGDFKPSCKPSHSMKSKMSGLNIALLISLFVYSFGYRVYSKATLSNRKQLYQNQEWYTYFSHQFNFTLIIYFFLIIWNALAMIMGIHANINDYQLTFFMVVPITVYILFFGFILYDYHYPKYNETKIIKELLMNKININSMVSLIMEYIVILPSKSLIIQDNDPNISQQLMTKTT